MDDVDEARQKLNLPSNRFAHAVGGGGIGAAWIVCRCIHCGTIFKSMSHDLADVDHICRGDCGCQSKQAVRVQITTKRLKDAWMPKVNVVDGVAWVGARTATPGECAERIAELEASIQRCKATISTVAMMLENSASALRNAEAAK